MNPLLHLTETNAKHSGGKRSQAKPPRVISDKAPQKWDVLYEIWKDEMKQELYSLYSQKSGRHCCHSSILSFTCCLAWLKWNRSWTHSNATPARFPFETSLICEWDVFELVSVPPAFSPTLRLETWTQWKTNLPPVCPDGSWFTSAGTRLSLLPHFIPIFSSSLRVLMTSGLAQDTEIIASQRLFNQIPQIHEDKSFW